MTAITRTGHRYRDKESGKTLDVWFPPDDARIARRCLAETVGLIEGDFVTVAMLAPETPPASAEEAYLRLYLLSELAFRPNTLNLDGVFGLLETVAWTSAGPVLPARVRELRARLQGEAHHLQVPSIDKFPRMTDYVIPEGVRIADADRVRLGAHLSPGTTVMHEGFVNFNAGTLGESMVEGRVTPGVIVGRNSDVGAGASIMGVLSGGGKQVNSVGERSLIGANAGIGISLGDECIVEAGLYVTAGSKVRTPEGRVVKARELSGRDGPLFRRDRHSGVIERGYARAERSGGLGWRRLRAAHPYLNVRRYRREAVMTTATLTSKGQITIPAAVRDSLGVKTGDRVEFVEVASGRFELVAATRSVMDLKGMFGAPAKSLSLEEIDGVIARNGASAKDPPR